MVVEEKSMGRIRTTGNKADEWFESVVTEEDLPPVPWNMVGHVPEARTLACVPEEVIDLFNALLYLRPGYEAEDGKVHIPNLFVKFSGLFEQTPYFTSANLKKLKKAGLIFDSIKDFKCCNTHDVSSNAFTGLLGEDGLIDRSALYSSAAYKYSYLRIEYQDIFVERLNYLLANKDSIFQYPDAISDDTILNAVLNIDPQIMMLYQNYDYQYDVPYIIIRNEDRRSFTTEQGCVLALLDLLGFDIIIVSDKGYADVENIIKKDLFDVHYNYAMEENSFRSFLRKKTDSIPSRKVLNGLAAAAAVLLLTLGIYGASRMFGNKTGSPAAVGTTETVEVDTETDQVGDTESGQTEADKSIAGQTETGYTEAGLTETETSREQTDQTETGRTEANSTQSSQEATGQTVAGNAEVKFADAAFEKVIRSLLDKPDGVIYAADLEQVREIAVWGDLTGYPSETGREGMSGEELWFMDEEGNLHTERGGIRSLEDLKWFPNLMYFQLVYNEVEDISILADMKKLVSADLSFNRISDISPLAEAKNLMTLHITDNQISDISALSNLKHLRTLSLQNNNVEDLEPLKDMEQLESL
ncbi:MAG TPA: YceG family protein, partial [Clostridiales bacterium]|nr:YceG family protein [Clostridiales bacterium]